MGFSQAANFTGLPACTVPMALATDDDMPISVQFIGSAWCEDKLLAVGRACESFARMRRPDVYFDLLADAR